MEAHQVVKHLQGQACLVEKGFTLKEKEYVSISVKDDVTPLTKAALL